MKPTPRVLTKTRNGQGGFTLIEAMIAVMILIIGILSLYTMQVGAIHANARADSVSHMSSWATDRIEEILANQHDYDELVENDGEDDGAGHDINENGIDDVDEGHGRPWREFGLNDPKMRADGEEPPYQSLGFNCDAYEGPMFFQADYCEEAPESRGLIFWNIAEDTPTKGVKTIRVKVVTKDFGAPFTTSTTYFKTKR
ncbi:MAG: prepilin-type N-terminal cleavage/methylation domain-containing protein [Desulfobulbaceae bacterium]|nr:prepilin-type N-terminal cleavage/methylation domain-containing protein [Desulfobulbaceae bacterium]